MTNDKLSFNYDAIKRNPGDRIRAEDWNTAMQAIANLSAHLFNRTAGGPAAPFTGVGATALQEPLVVNGSLGVGTTNPQGQLEVVTAAQNGTGLITGENALTSDITGFQGSPITGNGTTFLIQLRVGDRIMAAGQTRVVVRIDSDTRLYINTFFQPQIVLDTPFTFAHLALLVQEGKVGIGAPARRGLLEVVAPAQVGAHTMLLVQDGAVGIGTPGPRGLFEVATPQMGTGVIVNHQSMTADSSGFQGSPVNGTGTAFLTQLRMGDSLIVNGQARTVNRIDSDTALFINRPFDTPIPWAIPFSFTRPVLLVKDDNVGIGTLQASEKLEVNGTVKATRFVGDGSGLTGIQGGGSSQWVNKADGTGIYYSAGGVTIGTTNKGATLQILNRNQDPASGDTLLLGRSEGSHVRLGYHADYGWMQSGGGKPLLINPLEGNVGIGTTDPGGYKLKVQSGDTYLGGALTVTGSLDVKGEINALFFKAGQGNTRRVPTASWYRIAEHPGHWANAEFTLRDTSATRGRSSLTFRIGSNINQAESISFTLLNHSRYYATTFTRLRILTHPNQGAHYLEVYVDPGGYPEEVSYSIYDNLHINAPHSYGWQPANWEEVTAIPPGYTVSEFDIDKLFSVGDNHERFSVAREGNVGIGRPSPKAKLDVDGYILEKLDVVAVGGREDWTSETHPLLQYFKEKLQGLPVGTMMRGLTDLPKWKPYYWLAWVSGPNEVRVWRNDDKDTELKLG